METVSNRIKLKPKPYQTVSNRIKPYQKMKKRLANRIKPYQNTFYELNCIFTVFFMNENYKITKQIALRIVELKANDGLSSSKILEILKSEFDNFEISRISINRFYASYLKGTSKILPANAINIEIKKTVTTNQNAKKSEKTIKVDSGLNKAAKIVEDDNPILNQLSDGKSLTKAEKPSSDFMDFYNPNK